MTANEKFESLTKQLQEISVSNHELQAQNEYLKKQLGNSMKQKQKLQEPSFRTRPSQEEEASNDYYDEEVPFERIRREMRPSFNSNDFKVEILEFEGKLDADEFLEWSQIIERVFEYKDVPDERKVKLPALRLRKYASLWWTNLIAKRSRERKSKI